ncbi:protein-glutamate methylesterase/protein-glutamine glutaminase [Ancylobacter sp. SL191]|uniref:protein-glutamate methylesterase/protein-glutamine glutaminase n=1 Tax=Ancylobacter sp. SL191 TaxID=2995166 RepID=UPI00226EEF8D|nr:chemotaxis response regulator protein-glutamate methylesterase [Ancylobacter sp. SL191]WAC29057.1 chemotaxis response regulator protein-glutamate methylesterase [Ancylobacter sp. SL191]
MIMATAPSTAAPPQAGPPIKVMIVDDSVFMRGVLSNWFGESGEFQVVASHPNGRRAADDVQRAQPDVIILDLEMPDMDGLTALPLILERKPGTAVLVASSLTRRGAEVSLRALTLGAADYIPKPDANRGVSAAEEFRAELMAKARGLGQRARRRSLPRPPVGAVPAPAPVAVSVPVSAPVATPSPMSAASAAKMPQKLRSYSMMPVGVLAVGSSTGGPQALTRLFTDIGPAIATLPVLIVQHMPPTFTSILAEHVARASGRPCAEAKDGEPILPGRIYVAPGGIHMDVVRDGGTAKIRLFDGPAVNFCKPAVDPMFQTVASVYGAATLALVLTGMGSDGAKGALRVAEAGGSVIAQDEESSVVWGMPGATAQIGACSGILPIGEIGRKVTRLIVGGRE